TIIRLGRRTRNGSSILASAFAQRTAVPALRSRWNPKAYSLSAGPGTKVIGWPREITRPSPRPLSTAAGAVQAAARRASTRGLSSPGVAAASRRRTRGAPRRGSPDSLRAYSSVLPPRRFGVVRGLVGRLALTRPEAGRTVPDGAGPSGARVNGAARFG